MLYRRNYVEIVDWNNIVYIKEGENNKHIFCCPEKHPPFNDWITVQLLDPRDTTIKICDPSLPHFKIKHQTCCPEEMSTVQPFNPGDTPIKRSIFTKTFFSGIISDFNKDCLLLVERQKWLRNRFVVRKLSPSRCGLFTEPIFIHTGHFLQNQPQ